MIKKSAQIISASLLKSIEEMFIPFETGSTPKSRRKSEVIKKKQPRKSPKVKTIRAA
jgi:hypothetical protein